MSSFTAKNVTFRTYAIHADLVEQAADKVGKTISEYCRDIMIPIAAKELGVPVPKLPDMKRGRYSEIVESAAKLVGLTPEEFERQAAERMASAALGYASETVRTPSDQKLAPREGQRATARRNSTQNKRRTG